MRITLVHTPACHLCDDAQDALAAVATQYPVEVELVDAREPRGQVLVAAHRAGMFPLVLIDDAFFSAGRLPRRKLCRLLESRVVA